MRAAPLLLLLLSRECQAIVLEGDYYNSDTCNADVPAMTIQYTLGACTNPTATPVWSTDANGNPTEYKYNVDYDRSAIVSIAWNDPTEQSCTAPGSTGTGFTVTYQSYSTPNCSGTPQVL